MMFKKIEIFVLLFFFPFLVCANETYFFTPADVNSLHSNPPDHKLYYGKDLLQFGELRLPEGKGLFPVAIVVHGGCWLSQYANVKNTAALSEALRDIGIATWNIEYRPADHEKGGYPETFKDVGAGADLLKTIAAQYSLDLDKVIVIGHSAGGHLALWMAARHKLDPNSALYTKDPIALHGAIILGGIPDLKSFRSQAKNTCGSDVVGKLLGDSSPKFESRYKETSPVELLPLGIPQILIYGKEDYSVPASLGKSYMQMAKKKGDAVTLFEIEFAGHHEYLVPNSVTWPRIISSVRLLNDNKL